jgi:hypothetical protein
MAPSVNDYYTLLGGKAPGAGGQGKGELENLLDADDDLEFNPKEIVMDSSQLDIDFNDTKPVSKAPPKPPSDGKPDLSKMTLAEQL